ncbi:SURF1 family protein [Gemmatimonas aurantiaca]|uniref:SURF1 family protein n=1 Tax=Gemmatimonas aurantiaca TaxID=173480 RepID=UPI00301C07EC
MSRGKLLGFGLLTAIAVFVCVRLGIWQLHRLGERQAQNAVVSERGAMPPLDLASLQGQDTTVTHWRRVRVHALADYAHEAVHATRSQAGAPGVHLLTPIIALDGGWADTAIVLVRGYIYSPDARTIDHDKVREGDTLTLDALVLSYPPARVERVTLPSNPRAVRVLNHDSLSRIMGQPLAPFLLLALGDTTVTDVAKLTRIPPPSLGEGPHRSYAFQWFGFATVFLVGFVAVARSKRPPKA